MTKVIYFNDMLAPRRITIVQTKKTPTHANHNKKKYSYFHLHALPFHILFIEPKLVLPDVLVGSIFSNKMN